MRSVGTEEIEGVFAAMQDDDDGQERPRAEPFDISSIMDSRRLGAAPRQDEPEPGPHGDHGDEDFHDPTSEPEDDKDGGEMMYHGTVDGKAVWRRVRPVGGMKEDEGEGPAGDDGEGLAGDDGEGLAGDDGEGLAGDEGEREAVDEGEGEARDEGEDEVRDWGEGIARDEHTSID